MDATLGASSRALPDDPAAGRLAGVATALVQVLASAAFVLAPIAIAAWLLLGSAVEAANVIGGTTP